LSPKQNVLRSQRWWRWGACILSLSIVEGELLDQRFPQWIICLADLTYHHPKTPHVEKFIQHSLCLQLVRKKLESESIRKDMHI
jgi:hypothetical protein